MNIIKTNGPKRDHAPRAPLLRDIVTRLCTKQRLKINSAWARDLLPAFLARVRAGQRQKAKGLNISL